MRPRGGSGLYPGAGLVPGNRRDPHHFPVLVGLWRFALIQGEILQAHELGVQLLDLAERARDAALRLEAQRALGMTLYFLGDLWLPACIWSRA